MHVAEEGPLFHAIDCVRVPVADLDQALAFYRDGLGHELAWRTPTAVGLRLPGGPGEIVLHTDDDPYEPNFLVDSVEDAVRRFVAAGGALLHGPFDIRIGRCAVVRDPWGNTLTMLDMSKGALRPDAEGNIID